MGVERSKIRDLAAVPRHIPTEVEGTVAYEVPFAMFRLNDPTEEPKTFDLGADFQQAVNSKIDAGLASQIEKLGGPNAWVWLALNGLLATAPHPHTPDEMYRWLAGIDRDRLMRWLIGYASRQGDPSLVEQAVSGDAEALAELVGERVAIDETLTIDPKHKGMMDHLQFLLGIENLPDRLVDAISGFRDQAFADYEEEFAAAISRAAAARRASPMRADAKTVIEEVTSGIDYTIPLGVTRVLLVPSMVVRPLSLIDQHRETLMVFYGIADEFVSDDPETPPSWLVRTYKALSDENRLRILRRLAESETTLDELTDMLGLSKSTVHYHLSALRAAGLVRVRLSDIHKHSAYTLRRQALTDASGLLDSYIRMDRQGEKHG